MFNLPMQVKDFLKTLTFITYKLTGRVEPFPIGKIV